MPTLGPHAKNERNRRPNARCVTSGNCFVLFFAWKITEKACNVRKSKNLSCHLVMTHRACGKKSGQFGGAETHYRIATPSSAPTETLGKLRMYMH
jgi:hypothetical protein